jgi:hypothetical protein
MSILAHTEIRELHDAVLGAGLAQSRDALMGCIRRDLVAGIAHMPNARDQVMVDLCALNEIEVPVHARLPLHAWLANAAQLAGPRAEAAVFQRALDRVRAARHGATSQHARHPTTPGAARGDATLGGVVTLRDVHASPPTTRALRGGARHARWIGRAALALPLALSLGLAIHLARSDKHAPAALPEPEPQTPAGEPARGTPAPPAPTAIAPAFVALRWEPTHPSCPTDPPEILLDDCRERRGVGWLQMELHALRDRGVACLSGLPASFVLRPDPSETGIKAYYLNIYDPSDGRRIGNAWLQEEALVVTDITRSPRVQVKLRYDRHGSWWVLREGLAVPAL